MIRTAELIGQLTGVGGGPGAAPALTLDVPRGEIHGVLGAAASGKSALLMMLATLERPVGGEAWIDGHSVREDPGAVRRSIGYVPELAAAYDDMAVRDYLEFYARAAKIPDARIADTIDGALAGLGLAARGGEFMAALDRETRQRLAFVKATLHNPAALLIDQPGAGLDLAARRRLAEAVRALRTPERAILLASHVMADLAGVCDNIYVLAQGQILAQGSPAILAPHMAGARVLEIRAPTGAALDGLCAALRRIPGVLQAEPSSQGTLLAAIDFALPDPCAIIGALRAAGHLVSAYRELEFNIAALLEKPDKSGS